MVRPVAMVPQVEAVATVDARGDRVARGIRDVAGYAGPHRSAVGPLASRQQGSRDCVGASRNVPRELPTGSMVLRFTD